MHEATEKAIQIAGGPAALARKLGTDRQRVGYWQRVGRIPAEMVLAVEAAVQAQVTRYELRPDVYGE